MSRERDAIELIWEVLEDHKRFHPTVFKTFFASIEQILTQMEDLIQEDLEQMERSSTRSRETPKTCPLLEEFNKSQAATNTRFFWQDADYIRSIVEGIEAASPLRLEDPAEGDTYSPI